MNTPPKYTAQEKRQEPRVREHAGVTVTVVSAPEVPGLEGRVFHTNSVDLSVNGIQVYLEIPVPVGSELQLEVVFGQSSTSYTHTGYVMWDRDLGDAATDIWIHHIGINFKMDLNLKIMDWVEAVQGLYTFYDAI